KTTYPHFERETKAATRVAVGLSFRWNGSASALTSYPESMELHPHSRIPLRPDCAKRDNCCSEGDAGGHNRRKLRRRPPKSSTPEKLNGHNFPISLARQCRKTPLRAGRPPN